MFTVNFIVKYYITIFFTLCIILVSRFITQICNQLASLCHEYVSEVVKPGHIDKLWQVIEEEITKAESTPPVFKVTKRGIRKKELVYDDDRSLVGRYSEILI